MRRPAVGPKELLSGRLSPSVTRRQRFPEQGAGSPRTGKYWTYETPESLDVVERERLARGEVQILCGVNGVKVKVVEVENSWSWGRAS